MKYSFIVSGSVQRTGRTDPREGVPNRAALRFLDHLDRTRRNAYSARFNLVSPAERKIYKNFFV